MKMFAASVGSDSLPVNKNETIINNATATSPYQGRFVCQCHRIFIPVVQTELNLQLQVVPQVAMLSRIYLCETAALWWCTGGCKEPWGALLGGKEALLGGKEAALDRAWHLRGRCVTSITCCLQTVSPHLLTCSFSSSLWRGKCQRLSLPVCKATLVNNEELCR